MRHCGIHWPENAGGEHPNRDAIIALPGMAGATLICSPSARYHYDHIRKQQPSAIVVWRAIPRQGKLPAQLGWDGKRVADECLNLWDEQPHGGIEWFTPLNELQFVKEAGENFRGYGYVAAKLADLRIALQDRFRALGQTVRLVFPAWVPQDDGDRLDDWRHEAAQWDAIGVHCYGSAETMRARYQSYRDAFPGKPLFVGEWNSNHEGHDERASLAMWAEISDTDPLFLGATYYIWETQNAGENDLSIWGNPDRLALFRDPPLATAPEPIPAPEPAPMPTTREQVIEISNRVADEVGIPRLLLLACAIAESNLRWDARRPADPSQDADYWGDVSFGPWQQTARWSAEYLAWCDEQGHPPGAFPGSDVIEAVFDHYRNTEHAARVAAAQLKRKYLDGEADGIWRALNRYNYPAGGGEPKTAANGQNYRRGITEAQAILGETPIPTPITTVYEQYPDPQPAGTFTAAPLGVIFHGSRSGKAGNPLDAEYRGTANYEVDNPLGLGWNATVGPGKVAIHMDARTWGHNARAASDKYIGVEISQPTVNDPLPDSVPRALADYIFDHVWSVWGELWHFPSHAELEAWGETGQKDGKTDLFPTGDERMNVFREKVYARLRERQGVPVVPEPPIVVPPADTRLERMKALAQQIIDIANEPAA